MSSDLEKSPPNELRPNSAARKQLLGRLGRLVLKELREVFRDRRTIVTLVVMPVLIYPLLALVFQRFLLTSLSPQHQSEFEFGIESELDKSVLLQQLLAGESRLNRGTPRSENEQLKLPNIRWTFAAPGAIHRSVAASELHLGLVSRRTGGGTSKPGLASALDWELIYRSGTPASIEALHFVESRLQALADSQLDQQLRELGVTAVLPAAVRRTPIQMLGAPVFSLAALIPLILVLTTVTGAVYPAIDLTAGERERGTMEMLVAAPVPRMGLLLSKYVAVLCVALLTAIVNLVGMTITAQSTGLAAMLFGEAGMTLAVVFKVWLLLGLFAAFFSAVLLAITSYARSFKEAQAYIIPLMLICLVPGVICLLPNLEFTGPLAVTPLVNIVMLGRDVLEGGVSPGLAAAAVLSTALYVAASIALAGRIFGTDAVLYGGPSTWSDVLRRPAELQFEVSPSAAMFALALMFPSYFLAAGLMTQRTLPADTEGTRAPNGFLESQLISGLLITALVFAAIPSAVAVFHRVRPDTGLGLRRPRALSLFAATLLGLAIWPFAYEIFFLGEWLGVRNLAPSQLLQAQENVEHLRSLPLILLLASLAIGPGICEEFFFRGLLYSSLRRSLHVMGTIIVTAILFGFFHTIVGTLFLPERFLPSAFLGLVLGWVRWKTGSVIPAMMLHSTVNGAILLIAYWQEELLARGIGISEQARLPPTWLAGAALMSLIASATIVVAGPSTIDEAAKV